MSYYSEFYYDRLIESAVAELECERWCDRGIWITADGKYVKIENMGDSHLNNAIRYLERINSNWADGARASYIQQMKDELELRHRTGKTIQESIYIDMPGPINDDFDDPPEYYPSDGFGDFDVCQS